MNEPKATLIGSTAVLLWGTLALFTTQTGALPPFQLVTMTFSIAFLMVMGKWLWRGESLSQHLYHPLSVWLLGIGGLFGYHFFYFMALKNAPAVEASLIAYLWPLLIVVFSALLPGEKLRWFHLTGALMGLFGCYLLISNGGQMEFRAEFAKGYLAAITCALIWSSYSVLSRCFKQVATDTVGWFCLGTALLGLLCHLLFESTLWPKTVLEWLAVLGLGLGPVGLAFFTWDYGVKHGNIRILGTLSYGAPLISTLLLILFGQAQATWVVIVACLVIVGGALLASRNLSKK